MILPDPAPADEVPADEVPADEVPADEVPADEAPAFEAPAFEGSRYRACPGFPRYMVDLSGNVLRDGKVLAVTYHERTGHARVRLYGPGGHLRGTKGGNYANVYVHRLVCAVWHGPCPDGHSLVRHLDNNPRNNVPENLAWGTNSENMLDYWATDARHDRRERRCQRDADPEYVLDPELGF